MIRLPMAYQHCGGDRVVAIYIANVNDHKLHSSMISSYPPLKDDASPQDLARPPHYQLKFCLWQCNGKLALRRRVGLVLRRASTSLPLLLVEQTFLPLMQ